MRATCCPTTARSRPTAAAMRTQCIALVVVLLVAMVAAQQVITDFSEFQRKQAEYQTQKKKYDEFQALKNVPLLASYDLIPKVMDSEAPAGRAEQLLPTYTGIPTMFQAAEPTMVEPGNTAQNYFHSGPIPAKKAKSEPQKPVVIPTAPGQDFVIPQDDGPAGTTASAVPEAAPAPAPTAVTASFSEATAAPAPTAVTASFSEATAAPQQALFFGLGALPVTTSIVQADAPIPASVSFAPMRSFEGSSSAISVGLRTQALAARAPAPVPLRPLALQFQFAPSLPYSDFHPGPVRALGPQPAYSPAPLGFARRPAATYGAPGLGR